MQLLEEILKAGIVLQAGLESGKNFVSRPGGRRHDRHHYRRGGDPIGAPAGRPYDPNKVIGAAKGGAVKSPHKNYSHGGAVKSSRKKSTVDGIARTGLTRAPHK